MKVVVEKSCDFFDMLHSIVSYNEFLQKGYTCWIEFKVMDVTNDIYILEKNKGKEEIELYTVFLGGHTTNK